VYSSAVRGAATTRHHDIGIGLALGGILSIIEGLRIDSRLDRASRWVSRGCRPHRGGTEGGGTA
jgi:hypothetical protein